MPASVVRERSNDIARICDLMCLGVMVVLGRDPGEPLARLALGGFDELAGGSWLAINDHGVVAGILNRFGTLGPQE